MDPRDPDSQPELLADGLEWKDAIARSHLSVAEMVEEDRNDSETPKGFEIEFEPLETED
jgi:hypothetical protein